MKSLLKVLQHNSFFQVIAIGMFGLLAFLLSPSANAEQHIAWVPSLRQALNEAKQTGRPILLTSAAPSCGGVPGVW